MLFFLRNVGACSLFLEWRYTYLYKTETGVTLMLFCGAVFNSNKPTTVSRIEDHMQFMYISMTYRHPYISAVTLHLFIFLLKGTISANERQ
jgi:hypothetical protein